MKREIPNISIEGTKGYAKLLAHNFDSVQECFNLRMPDSVAAQMDRWQEDAIEAFDGEQEYTVRFGGEDFQIWVGGAAGGVKWVLKNDDIQFFFKAPLTATGKTRTWAVSVRYLSGGLWEYGIDALKIRAESILFCEQFKPMDNDGAFVDIEPESQWQRISRIDYAFDFYSPCLSGEMESAWMKKKFLLPSGVKIGVISTSKSDETLTIGLNRSGLSTQIYDKGKEITEKSGKTWMYDIWARNGFVLPEDGKAHDVWRMEIRFGKEFLKNRMILSFAEFKEKMQEFLCEAIFTRRMTVLGSHEHKERFDLHPLYAECYKATEQAGQYAPMGRQMTLRRDSLIEVMDRQIQGTARAREVLRNGEYSEDNARFALNLAGNNIAKDPEHLKKIEKAQERYKFVDEAR